MKLRHISCVQNKAGKGEGWRRSEGGRDRDRVFILTVYSSCTGQRGLPPQPPLLRYPVPPQQVQPISLPNKQQHQCKSTELAWQHYPHRYRPFYVQCTSTDSTTPTDAARFSANNITGIHWQNYEQYPPLLHPVPPNRHIPFLSQTTSPAYINRTINMTVPSPKTLPISLQKNSGQCKSQ